MKVDKRKEVLRLVKPPGVPGMSLDQANAEKRHYLIVGFVAGIATPFVVIPLFGFLFL